MSKTILVTGATGNTASQLIPLLLKSGVKVRAIVRNPEKAKKLAESGVTVFPGDLDHPRSLGNAFDGIDSLMSIVANGPRAPQNASSALWAARQGGVKHVVRLSAMGAAHDAPTVNSRLHALSDAELERSGIAFTILKPHFFMSNLFMNADSVAKEGVFYTALGDGKLAMIDVPDIAEVAAKVLTTPGHEGKTYTLTGPQSLTMNDVAVAFSEVLGKPVKHVAVPVSVLDENLTKFGMDEYMRGMLIDYMNAYAKSWGSPTTNTVQELLGHAPRSVADFARGVAPAFGKR